MFYWLIAALWFRTVLKWTVSEAFKSYRICIAYTIWNERFTNDRIRKWLIATLFHCIYPYWNWRFPKHLNCIGSVLITYINYFILTFPRNLNCIGAVIRQQFFQRLVLPIKWLDRLLRRPSQLSIGTATFWHVPGCAQSTNRNWCFFSFWYGSGSSEWSRQTDLKNCLYHQNHCSEYYTTRHIFRAPMLKNIGIRTSNNMLLYFFGNNREGTLLNLTNFWNL